MKRRRFLFSFTHLVLGAVGIQAFAKAKASPLAINQHFKMGDLSPKASNPEISGVLILEKPDVLSKRSQYLIWGDGHSHEVIITVAAWDKLISGDKVVVRSGLGDEKNPHSHWVSVKIKKAT